MRLIDADALWMEFNNIGLTMFAIWINDNEVYPEELEEDE